MSTSVCTTFTTPTGVMRGHYEFRFLNREGQCEVQIPPLIFKSLPYTKAEEFVMPTRDRREIKSTQGRETVP